MATADEILGASRRTLGQLESDLTTALKDERSRKRGQLNRSLHEVRRMLGPDKYPFASQAGQDMAVDQLLGRKRRGVFVDVGGYDGVTGSNSLFFEQWRGWSGILVEPVPANLDKAKSVRRCPCLGFAVAATDGSADFIEVTQGYTQMSGLAQSYDAGLLEQVRRDPRHQEATLRVETRTLSRLLTDNNVPHPDFISLDIEGGEVETLIAFPFEQHNVSVWSIENNTGTSQIAEVMGRHGYDLVEFCGPDEIWRKRDL